MLFIFALRGNLLPIFADETRECSLALALWAAQRQVFPDPELRTYVHVGCHFNRIMAPGRNVTGEVRARILEARASWARVLKEEGDNEARDGESFIRFLSALLER